MQNQSACDEVKILSAGSEVRVTAAPIGPVGQVLNLAVTEGDVTGTVDAQWDPATGANSYEVSLYIGADPAGGTYTPVPLVTASKTTLSGLTSGQSGVGESAGDWGARSRPVE